MSQDRPPSLAPESALSRRRFVGAAVATLAAGWLASGRRLLAGGPADAPAPPRYRIGVCDWMMLKRQKPGAFPLAREIGADGVEVDMGGLGNRPTFAGHLAEPAVREEFLDASRRLGVAICSLAMSAFYAQSFAERPGVERLVQDCFDQMQALKVRVAFLPLGVRGDLVKHPELRPAIVARLKDAGARAAAARVVLGVETALDAAGEAQLLDDIGSPAVRSYFNFSNALQNGRDLEAELRTLGRERICQIHCTDQDGVWLQNDPKIDLPRVKQTLDAMGWSGWLVMERSRDARRAHDVKWNYGANARYLKSVFDTTGARPSNQRPDSPAPA